MYEKHSERLISIKQFARRLLRHGLWVFALVLFSAFAGALGFMAFEGRQLEDAILHSAYILSGFGLMEVPESFAGRLFAAAFGLYASLFFLAAFSIIFAPVVHRILHKMHLEDEE